MLYINYLFLYSIFGFLMESTVYKIGSQQRHSGIFYGPYTFVYGFGVLISILVYEFLEKKLKGKKIFFKVLLYFFLFTILLTIVEYLGGNILHFLFQIDMWDYSKHKFCFGKYICLTNAILWGILGTFNIYFLYPKVKKYLKTVPCIYTYILLFFFLIDFFLTVLMKIVL